MAIDDLLEQKGFWASRSEYMASNDNMISDTVLESCGNKRSLLTLMYYAGFSSAKLRQITMSRDEVSRRHDRHFDRVPLSTSQKHYRLRKLALYTLAYTCSNWTRLLNISANTKSRDFWDMTPCWLVGVYRHFEANN
jgi:hypothetical protein